MNSRVFDRWAWVAWQRIPAAWLGDLADVRIRAEVVESLYQSGIFTIAIHVAIAAVYFGVYPLVRQTPFLLILLLLFITVQPCLYAIELRIKQIRQSRTLTEQESAIFLTYRIASVIPLALCISILMLVFLSRDTRGLNSPAVFAALLYYFGAIIKNITVRLSVVFYSFVVLLPMAVDFMLRRDSADIALGIFVLMLLVTMLVFGRDVGRVMTTQIRQKHELELLGENMQLERDRADAANAAKSQFFTAASHDARQPLQAISLLFDGLATSPTLSEPDRKVIDKVGANLHSIRNLFDRVLDISRIESGSVTPHFQAIPLQHIFNALDAQFGEFAASKNLWLRFAPTQAVVWHDADLLERMVGNVIHNALKFTQSGGVWVGYRVKRGRLEVRDSGVGITEAEQARIFEEFYQLDNRARRRDLTAGLGLGLSIVKRLAELTHTPVGVRSAAGRGATFWLGLNAAPNQVHSPLAQLAPQAVPASIPIAAQLKDLAILLVEDDAELRSLLARLLSERGAYVRACADAPQAYQLLSATENAGAHFDVVLTDYRLGEGGSGADVVRSARQLFGEALPVVVLTGDTNGQGFQELTLKPYTQVLHKPVSIEQLVAVLQEAC